MKRLQIVIENAVPAELDALERTVKGYGATLENTSRAGRITEIVRADETAPAFVKYRALVTLPADTNAERAEVAITRAVTRSAGVIEAAAPAAAPQKSAQQPLRASEQPSAGAGVAAFAKAAGCSAEEAAARLERVRANAAAELAVRAATGELERPSGLPTEADLKRLGI